jgi:hypothetical protein
MKDPAPGTAAWARVARHVVGGLYLVTAGINVGLVVADPSVYGDFADESFLPVVPRLWQDVVMAAPTFWFLLLAAGELLLGVLLLLGGRAARAGWVGVVVFHLLLMLFGLGFWFWSVPALALLVPAARADWPHLAGGTPAPRPDSLRRSAP